MNDTCKVSATQDMYGVGIRIGIYCQWLASLLAGVALPAEADKIQANTLCFQSAILAALVLLTVQGNLKSPEVLVIVPLAFGGFLTAQVFDSSKATSASTLRLLITVQLVGALAGYNAWYWWNGVNEISPKSCTYYTFICGKVHIERLRIFGIITSIIGCLFFVVAEIFFFIWSVLVCINGGSRATIQFITTALYRAESNPPARWRIWARIAVSTALVAYIIVMIEMTITWNPIENANGFASVGQLVPLIIGGTGLLNIVYRLFQKRVKRTEENLPGQDTTFHLVQTFK